MSALTLIQATVEPGASSWSQPRNVLAVIKREFPGAGIEHDVAPADFSGGTGTSFMISTKCAYPEHAGLIFTVSELEDFTWLAVDTRSTTAGHVRFGSWRVVSLEDIRAYVRACADQIRAVTFDHVRVGSTNRMVPAVHPVRLKVPGKILWPLRPLVSQ